MVFWTNQSSKLLPYFHVRWEEGSVLPPMLRRGFDPSSAQPTSLNRRVTSHFNTLKSHMAFKVHLSEHLDLKLAFLLHNKPRWYHVHSFFKLCLNSIPHNIFFAFALSPLLYDKCLKNRKVGFLFKFPLWHKVFLFIHFCAKVVIF